jgi:hypothetical protein
VTLSDNLESGISDITTEAIIYFCGSEIKTLPSPKLEASFSNQIQRIRSLDDISTQTIRKYIVFLLENLSHGKLLTPRDSLLLVNALASGIVKLINEKEEKETISITDFDLLKEKNSLELKELQRKLDNSLITLEESKAEMTR